MVNHGNASVRSHRGRLALAWIATRFGWQANLWVLLAFAAGALACGVAIGAIENKIKA